MMENSRKKKGTDLKAIAKFVRYSPYKIRAIADVIRGKDVLYALNWLTTYKTQRAEPIKKALESAVANAKNLQALEPSVLMVKEIKVDQGPMRRYFKPGAQGRAKPQRNRMCHISVTVQPKTISR
jgi:large subunit ribosomal protein L22